MQRAAGLASSKYSAASAVWWGGAVFTWLGSAQRKLARDVSKRPRPHFPASLHLPCAVPFLEYCYSASHTANGLRKEPGAAGFEALKTTTEWPRHSACAHSYSLRRHSLATQSARNSAEEQAPVSPTNTSTPRTASASKRFRPDGNKSWKQRRSSSARSTESKTKLTIITTHSIKPYAQRI